MDPKEVLLRHFEKVVAVIVGLWLIFEIASPMIPSMKPDPTTGGNLGVMTKTITDWMETSQVEQQKIADPSGPFREQLDSREVPSTVDAFGPWLMHKRPNFLYTLSAGPSYPPPEHYPPVNFTLAKNPPDRGKIELSWADSQQNKFVSVIAYTVWRKEQPLVNGPTSDWKQIGEVPPNDQKTYTFADTNLQPKGTYWYQLRDKAKVNRNEPGFGGANNPNDLAEDKKVLSVDLPQNPISTQQDIYITFDGQGTEDDPVKGVVGKATVNVWKYDPEQQKFLKSPLYSDCQAPDPTYDESKYPKLLKAAVTDAQRAARAIGKKDKAKIDSKTYKDMDFSTHATVEGVTTKDVPILDNSGNPMKGANGQALTRHRMVIKIHWPWGEDQELEERIPPPEIMEQLKKEAPSHPSGGTHGGAGGGGAGTGGTGGTGGGTEKPK